ncbi:MAG: polyhydroxybutyrate depolymerase [Rhizobiaceae bacterium]|nr:polyhydroxybutyrate depolymerase [Rhizobiaceae bacterium]
MTWKLRLAAALISVICFALPTSVLAECQPDEYKSTAYLSCEIQLGHYALHLPEVSDEAKPVPALLYFHGAGSSGPKAMRNKGMLKTFTERGYAIIAPSGLRRPNSRFGPGWSFLPFREKRRDELAFAHQILEDAARNHNINRDKILVSGFSVGGSLAWYLACQDPDLGRAFAPVAGAFWRPHPASTDCKSPIKLLHTHGWRDGTVPLEGRPLGGGRIYQGDVFEGLRIMRKVNGCAQLRANKFNTAGKFWRRKWTRCVEGSALEFALHTGGHGVPKGWAEMAIDWFEKLD